jgi:uncharacterized protein (TIGR00730 family)
MIRSLCVFCGSRPGARPEFAAAAQQTGSWLARHGITLVFGGSQVGLMGLAADAALAAGGHVIGVIPRALMDREIGHTGVADLRIVGSMHERKALMAELSGAFLALPGGYGTLDELCEILTWALLGMHRKPVGLLNLNGYFDGLLLQLDRAVQDGFLSPAHRGLLLASNTLEEFLPRLVAADPSSLDRWVEP